MRTLNVAVLVLLSIAARVSAGEYSGMVAALVPTGMTHEILIEDTDRPDAARGTATAIPLMKTVIEAQCTGLKQKAVRRSVIATNDWLQIDLHVFESAAVCKRLFSEATATTGTVNHVIGEQSRSITRGPIVLLYVQRGNVELIATSRSGRLDEMLRVAAGVDQAIRIRSQ